MEFGLKGFTGQNIYPFEFPLVEVLFGKYLDKNEALILKRHLHLDII